MKKIKLGNKIISQNSKPYIIAEIGVNHEGSFEKAIELIRLAKAGGADAAKFQTYKAEKIASKNSPSYWDLSKESTKSQYELFKKYDSFGKEEYVKLAEFCKSIDIDFLSTPFDEEAVDFLDPLMSFYKIASADITNLPMLRQIAKKKKPVVISTGASTVTEIEEAVLELEKGGVSEIAILHCVLNYPTPPERANLNVINTLERFFPNYIIGYSDHVKPDDDMQVLLTSYLLGARIIEKHFTYNKELLGNDHYHAMDKEDLINFNQKLEFVQNLLGSSQKIVLPEERISRENARRSIVAKKQIEVGQVINESMITYKRPGTGISTRFWDEVIGKKTNRKIEEDEIIEWSSLT